MQYGIHRISVEGPQAPPGAAPLLHPVPPQCIPHLDLKHVKRPREVKELIHKHVEEAKDKHRMRATELVGGGEDDGSYDPDDDLNE